MSTSLLVAVMTSRRTPDNRRKFILRPFDDNPFSILVEPVQKIAAAGETIGVVLLKVLGACSFSNSPGSARK
jgi:hypothetical protein